MTIVSPVSTVTDLSLWACLQAQGNGGRGAAGTPHSIALACARQAAAAHSPLCQVCYGCGPNRFIRNLLARSESLQRLSGIQT